MSVWKSIDSAPRDATEIWLGAEGRVIIGWFNNGRWHSSWSEERLHWAPTHWQSFVTPAPPLTNGTRGSDV